MSLETDVLRALFRLARSRRRPATMNDLVTRVPARPRDVRRALASLEGAELVELASEGARLTLAGLAVAVAARAVRAERSKVTRIVPSQRRPHRPERRPDVRALGAADTPKARRKVA
jgi:hypothetical protein